ncbi:unnamed protein product, partial [Iphiclides podalirius]
MKVPSIKEIFRFPVLYVLSSESQLRDAVRSEVARAEAAEAALAVARREAADCRASASAAAAGAAQASAALAAVHDELAATKTKFELSERQRRLFEEKCSELTEKTSVLEREVQQLRPLQAAQSSLQRQYAELEGRVRVATEEARREASRLESELRRVERCARGGAEVRERARLAAAAHARDRRRAAADTQRAAADLQAANAEIARLGSLVSELQYRLTENNCNGKSKVDSAPDIELDSVTELRAALEAERAGAAKIEQALAAALSDNSILAAHLHTRENPTSRQTSLSKENAIATDMSPIDSFLAD